VGGDPPGGRISVAPYSPGQRRLIFGFSFLGTLLDGADFGIFLLFLAPLAKYFGTSLVNIGVIQATSYLAGIIGGILFGMIADQWGRRWGLTLTVATYSVFTLLSAFAPTFPILLVLRIVAGIGIGGESGIAFAYMMEAYPNRNARRGTASGLLQTMFIFGSLFATFLYVQTSAAFGVQAWRAAFAILGGGALIAVLIRLFMPESHVWRAAQGQLKIEPGSKKFALTELLQPTLVRRTILTTLLMTFAFFGAYAAGTYGAALWQTTYKLPAANVGAISYAGSVIAIVAYVTGGLLADAIGRRRAFIVMAAIGTVAYLAFGILGLSSTTHVNPSNPWTSPLVYLYLAISLGFGYFGAQGVWLSELFPTRVRSSGQNIAYYIGRAIGAGLAPLAALIIATDIGLGIRLAIAFGVIGTLGTLLVSLFLPETKGGQLAVEEDVDLVPDEGRVTANLVGDGV
jgi:MFS family permease